jgi:RNA polymerase sigma-70 factor (ECF subfamily)
VTVGVIDVELRASEFASRRAHFEQLYAEHYPRLAGYCFGLVGDRMIAADIAQETFTRLFARLTAVREPKAWVYLVATNLCHDRWRTQERDRLLDGRLQESSHHLAPAHDPWVRDLVDRLPDRLRVVVLLHYYADLPVADVAHALHRPVGTVKRRLSEARAILATNAGSDQ